MVMNSAFIKTSSPQTKRSGTSLPTPAGADYALTLSLSAQGVKGSRRKIDNQRSIAARRLRGLSDGDLQTDRMPGCLHLECISNPIWIFRRTALPFGGRQIAAHVAFDVELAALLQLTAELCVATRIDDCVHVHVSSDVRRELGLIAGKHVDDAGRQVACRDDFRKLQRRQRLRGRGDGDNAVATQNHRRNERDETEQRRLIRTKHNHHAGRLGKSEIEMGSGDRINGAKYLGELVGPTGVMDEAIDRERRFTRRCRPGRRSPGGGGSCRAIGARPAGWRGAARGPRTVVGPASSLCNSLRRISSISAAR